MRISHRHIAVESGRNAELDPILRWIAFTLRQIPDGDSDALVSVKAGAPGGALIAAPNRIGHTYVCRTRIRRCSTLHDSQDGVAKRFSPVEACSTGREQHLHRPRCPPRAGI